MVTSEALKKNALWRFAHVATKSTGPIGSRRVTKWKIVGLGWRAYCHRGRPNAELRSSDDIVDSAGPFLARVIELYQEEITSESCSEEAAFGVYGLRKNFSC